MTESVPDAWIECRCGSRHWGRHGAAGLLLTDGDRVVLQHRAQWSHQGGTWAFPGGAIREGEDAISGAVREATEEAGISGEDLTLIATSVLSHPDWSYTTVLAHADAGLDVGVTDAESIAVRWIPIEQVAELPLLPAFAHAWPRLRSMLALRPGIVVDAANVVGSRPDGWWRDRAGANARLIAGLDRLAATGVPASFINADGDTWWPHWHAVVEGAARSVAGTDAVTTHAAARDGDDTIVAVTTDLLGRRATAIVVTADRELRARVAAVGGRNLSPGRLLELLGR